MCESGFFYGISGDGQNKMRGGGERSTDEENIIVSQLALVIMADLSSQMGPKPYLLPHRHRPAVAPRTEFLFHPQLS